MSSISIDIQLEDIFYELDDKQIAAEMRRRKLEVPNETRQAVSDAINQIRRGDTLDAITTLEREFWPKWSSVHQSEVEFWAAKPVSEIVAAIANDNTVAPKEAALGAVA